MTTRIFVTGAGGPAAYSFMRAVAQPDVTLFAGDIDPYAAGLYLVGEDRRFILKRGDDTGFVAQAIELCRQHQIDVYVPTVDSELLQVSEAADRFRKVGTRVLVAAPETLRMTLDKWVLVQACQTVCPVPETAVFDDSFDATRWEFPLLLKPRRGAGGRGVRVVRDAARLSVEPRNAETIVQEYLPGAEYSVDVLSNCDGRVLAAVPRERLKIDSGIAVTGRTLHDAELQTSAGAVAERIGLNFVGNVQFRRDRNGVPKLLEVNARFPGTMPLTVASGVNMPKLSVELLLDRPMPPGVDQFRDLVVARYWEDRFVDPSALTTMEQHAQELRAHEQHAHGHQGPQVEEEHAGAV